MLRLKKAQRLSPRAVSMTKMGTVLSTRLLIKIPGLPSQKLVLSIVATTAPLSRRKSVSTHLSTSTLDPQRGILFDLLTEVPHCL